jgi:hypothetical protein
MVLSLTIRRFILVMYIKGNLALVDVYMGFLGRLFRPFLVKRIKACVLVEGISVFQEILALKDVEFCLLFKNKSLVAVKAKRRECVYVLHLKMHKLDLRALDSLESEQISVPTTAILL